jgi:hypothetical protein
VTIIRQFNVTNDLHWCKRKVPFIQTEDLCGFVAERNGKILGAVLLDNFLYSSCQATLIIDSPAAIKVGLLECATHFIFEVAKKHFIYVLVATTNTRSMRLCKRMGFKEKMRIPNGQRAGVDMVVLELKACDLNLKSRKALRGECHV